MSLEESDRRLIALVDAQTGRAAAAAGDDLACHAGCSPCCFGPFAITELDGWRLRRGLAELEKTEPAGVSAVRRRAADAVARQAGAFPSGQVGRFENPAEEEAFYGRFESDPCPALDPDTGACVVYAWRPICCRTYGPSVRIGGDDLPPCPLCFKDAAPGAIDAARRTIDVEEQEIPLTAQAESLSGRRGMTTVAFAITETP